jgi:transcriptional regulator with XRE-family HTH domain
VYRDRLEELRKEKGLSTKKWSELSGVSVDTINRIRNPENPDKDSPRITTLEELCRPLGVEVWEIFYIGEHSFVALQAELVLLREERDKLLAENAVQNATIDELKNKVDSLKDQIIDIHNYYIKNRSLN